MVLSVYEKQRILFYYRQGLKPSETASALRVEGIYTCRQTVARFVARFLATEQYPARRGQEDPPKSLKECWSWWNRQ